MGLSQIEKICHRAISKANKGGIKMSNHRIQDHPLIRRWAKRLEPLQKYPLVAKLCTYEVISYLFCGVLTTAVNYVSYFIVRALGGSVALSNALAWVFAVLFAYFSNKILVFQSRNWSLSALWKEFAPFLVCRLLSFAFDMAFVLITVDLLSWNEALAKIGSNVFVMVANYFASKFVIFKKTP